MNVNMLVYIEYGTVFKQESRLTFSSLQLILHEIIDVQNISMSFYSYNVYFQNKTRNWKNMFLFLGYIYFS